jgi:hypothetical protein
MPQLVGQRCVQCGQVIENYLAGLFCRDCGLPVHHACKSPNPALDPAAHCATCGSNLSAAPPTAGEDPSPKENAGYGMVADDVPAPRQTENAGYGRVTDVGSAPRRTKVRLTDDHRRREPRITLRGIISAGGALILLVIVGAGLYFMFRGPASEIEKIVRDGLKEKTGQEVQSVEVKEVRKHTYAGTAVFANGEVWDVDATVNGKQVRWRATPPKSVIEQKVRDYIVSLKLAVKSVSIARGADGKYSGTAEAVTGERFRVYESSADNPLLGFRQGQSDATMIVVERVE